MNTSRLREIVDLLLELEQKFQIQAILNEANTALQNIISQPQNPDFQKQFSNCIEQLRGSAANAREQLQPTRISLIDEIGGNKFFVIDLAGLIDDWAQKNGMTPAVTQQKLQELLNERQNYIDQITRLRDSLNAVGIKAINLGGGDAEIGILLPRELFNNELGSLIKELGEIKFILRAFSELATGTAEQIEVRQISTSDPQFFFHMSPATIALIGAAVTWVLNTWKQVEEIREARARTRKANVYTEQELQDFFDNKIKSTIAAAVESETNNLVARIVDKNERVHEQRQQLKASLELLLERIERGMTVEIRYLPPPPITDAAGVASAETAAFDEFSRIAPQLIFPKTEGTPVLQLSYAEQKLEPETQGDIFDRSTMRENDSLQNDSLQGEGPPAATSSHSSHG